ncbi:MocR-like pyridoxine biosynthesis transcription factor PdxR [Oceanibacterium hippocampi]|uniref:HTH-type transcriptional regulatory protein GabR n=1 Tax=Oceanibacterium hippocampi TaxID=745714 RepID=A0A1Y5TZ05_9PROT|nr:PLP-dependent aminotransferase family protein [Oceanibacterium hippocampi]SLN76267.1 HTH-type transcriptional regulatory protein GabR [Oceanibacterium hippocampi]
MRDIIFHLKHATRGTLQAQLREQLLDAILNRQLMPGQPLPSSRRLARQLGVARNTVMLTYQSLVEQGFVVSRERSGFFVNEALKLDHASPPIGMGQGGTPSGPPVDWEGRYTRHPSAQVNISKPVDWQNCPYPFIYGQIDPQFFPLSAWRDCSRRALAKLAVNQWSTDQFQTDDPLLIEQIRTRVLLRRGVRARDDEILITMGAQNALWLVSSLLFSEASTIGLEEPGYVDARNIFALRTGRLRPLPIDSAGLIVDDGLKGCDYVYVTPSHQSPSTVTMPFERRLALLERASADDFILIEDDYEGEINFVGEPTPALKSLDSSGRVLYVGSFSKNLAPGLRLGFLVAPPALIRELRYLRRLMFRHPPANNQRCAGLFLADGHYDSLIHRLRRVYRERWEVMGAALERHMPDTVRAKSVGGSSFWVRGPEGLDGESLARLALERGIVIEPGRIFFQVPNPPRNYFRLGFSSIPTDRIEPGIRLLAELVHAHSAAA